MSVLIQKAGLLTTVQDLGRNAYRRFGINPSGVMDRTAARLINILLGNDEGQAVLEMHFPAPKILLQANTIFAIGGADFSSHLDEQPVANWEIHLGIRGSVLRFAQKTSGNRAYLAIQGGFKIGDWLGSASTNLLAGIAGFKGRKLQSGDRIGFNSPSKPVAATHRIRISNSL